MDVATDYLVVFPVRPAWTTWTQCGAWRFTIRQLLPDIASPSEEAAGIPVRRRWLWRSDLNLSAWYEPARCQLQAIPLCTDNVQSARADLTFNRLMQYLHPDAKLLARNSLNKAMLNCAPMPRRKIIWRVRIAILNG